MKRAGAHVTKSKVLITKKNISFNNKQKKLNDSIDNKKINKNQKNIVVNEILPNKRNNLARKSSSSLKANQRSISILIRTPYVLFSLILWSGSM